MYTVDNFNSKDEYEAYLEYASSYKVFKEIRLPDELDKFKESGIHAFCIFCNNPMRPFEVSRIEAYNAYQELYKFSNVMIEDCITLSAKIDFYKYLSKQFRKLTIKEYEAAGISNKRFGESRKPLKSSAIACLINQPETMTDRQAKDTCRVLNSSPELLISKYNTNGIANLDKSLRDALKFHINKLDTKQIFELLNHLSACS